MAVYTRLQEKQLKNLKREFPTSRLRAEALKKWAIENGHSYEGAMTKVRKLKPRRYYTPRGSTKSIIPVQQSTLANGELSVKIKSLTVVGDILKISW